MFEHWSCTTVQVFLFQPIIFHHLVYVVNDIVSCMVLRNRGVARTQVTISHLATGSKVTGK